MTLQAWASEADPTDVSHPDTADARPLRPGLDRSRPRWHVLLPLSLVAVVSLAPIVGDNPTRGGGRVVFACLAALTLLAVLTGKFLTARLGIALIAIIAAFALPWQANWWPLPGAIGLGVYVLTDQVRVRPPAVDSLARPSRGSRGRLTRFEITAILVLAALATCALLIFHDLTPPALHFGAQLVNRLPTWSLALAGAGFVTVNAAVEEVLFRGIILSHLTPAIGTRPALILQAAGFGLLNLHGYPYGPIGVALTTAYGLLLGALRLKTGGLLAGWIAHTLADSVIFLLILQTATHTH
jgi:hypothetical protein